MKNRHQMLRHLDCAWERRGERQVIGMIIVEGTADGSVPEYWECYASEVVSAPVLASSLPHREPSERRQIAACFAGVTTWQRVCEEFGIDPASLPDTI